MLSSLKKDGLSFGIALPEISPAISQTISPQNPIAFFCHEFAITDSLSTYAGGLGILAGDLVVTASEENIPFVGIGLLPKKGLPTYPLLEKPNNDPENAGFSLVKAANGEVLLLEAMLEERVIYGKVWKKEFGSAVLYLLDSNVEKNSEKQRDITEYLYPDGMEKKLAQDFFMGIMGVKLLEALSITPSVYHLNEGHTAFVALGLALSRIEKKQSRTLEDAIDFNRPRVVSSKHTILVGAGLFFTKGECEKYFSSFLRGYGVSVDEFFALGADKTDLAIFSTARLLLRSASKWNAVSEIHARCERETFPENPVLIPITNGVSLSRWSFSETPKGKEFWEKHLQAKKALLETVKESTGVDLPFDSLLVVWARRFTSYKRPLLLFSDVARLKKMLTNRSKSVTIIISGQAHKGDQEGVMLLEKTLLLIKENGLSERVVYIPDYSIPISRKLVQGADVWLNTPKRGREACGTSGMKSALNGGLQFSVSDGWVDEVQGENYLWRLSEEKPEEDIYKKLEEEIVPAFYHRDSEGLPQNWIRRMEKTRELILKRFTAKRMLQDYISKLYFPKNQ